MEEEKSIKITKSDRTALGDHPKKRVHQLIKNEPKLKKRIKDLVKEVEALKENAGGKSPTVTQSEASTNEHKKSTKPSILTPRNKQAHEIFVKAMSGQDPFGDFPCPYECLIEERNLAIFYCAKGMTPPFTEKKVRYRQIYDINVQCRSCITLRRKQQELNALMRAKRRQDSDSSTRPAKVDYGESEGLPLSYYR